MRRVLHLIETTGPGGAETIFLSLVSRLDSERWTSLPVVRGPGWVADSLVSLGYEPLVVPSERRFDLGYVLRLRRLMRSCRVDIVHAHLASTCLYAGLAAALAGRPTVATFHGIPDLEVGPLKSWLIPRLTHRVAFVSESLRARAVDRGSSTRDATVVIRNGIDTDLFHPGAAPTLRQELGTRPDQILVGAVGNVRPLKDYPTFLRTAAALRTREPGRHHFVVIGATDSPQFTELLKLRSSLDLEKTVRFAGFRSDVAEVFRTLDVFLLTSSSEGFSLATVQAMATGVPVVATRCGGPEEILRDGVDGLLRPVGDAEALADAVDSLARDPELRLTMGRHARARAQSEFSLDVMVRRYEALYDRTLGRASAVSRSRT